MASAERQWLQMRDSQTHNRRASGTLQHADLVPQGQVLQFKDSART